MPAHRHFAAEVIPVMPRRGVLFFVSFGTPPTMTREQLHDDLASLFDSLGLDYVLALDWGPCATDPERAPGKGDGEHVHAVVWSSGWTRFAAALHEWAGLEGIDPQARDWTVMTGWCRYRDHGRSTELRHNLARVFAYIMKPPRDGRTRDLSAHVRACGVFAKPWRRFVCNATASGPRSVARYCRSCTDPAPSGATARWKFCGPTCRSRARRNRSSIVPAKWIVVQRPARCERR